MSDQPIWGITDEDRAAAYPGSERPRVAPPERRSRFMPDSFEAYRERVATEHRDRERARYRWGGSWPFALGFVAALMLAVARLIGLF